jgi:hypothetical protein
MGALTSQSKQIIYRDVGLIETTLEILVENSPPAKKKVTKLGDFSKTITF